VQHDTQAISPRKISKYLDFGRGGEDREQYDAEFQGAKESAVESSGIENEQ
jgi:hypothetical protein